MGELVYGRVAKLVPFGAFVQVGDGIEGLVHISEMSAHHVDLPEQVVTPGEELWVKIIDLDLDRRRISLSIKQAAEGGVVAAEYQEAFGDHAYDDQGNYVGYNDTDYADEARKAWAEYYEKYGEEAYRAAVEQYGHGPDPGGVLGEDGGERPLSGMPLPARPLSGMPLPARPLPGMPLPARPLSGCRCRGSRSTPSDAVVGEAVVGDAVVEDAPGGHVDAGTEDVRDDEVRDDEVTVGDHAGGSDPA